MAQTNVNIRMDDKLKKDFEKNCNELGLNMTTAFNIFARAVVRHRRIPFDIALDTQATVDVAVAPAPVAVAAEEPQRQGPNKKHYLSFSELLKDPGRYGSDD